MRYNLQAIDYIIQGVISDNLRLSLRFNVFYGHTL